VIAYATAVFVLGAPDPLAMTQVHSWQIYALGEGTTWFALVAVGYAIASIVHAIYMDRAASATLREFQDVLASAG
jgi:hypothetical protein